MTESRKFSGGYDAEKGVGSNSRLGALGDEEVLEILVEGKEMFVLPIASPEDEDEGEEEQNRVKSDTDFNDDPTLA